MAWPFVLWCALVIPVSCLRLHNSSSGELRVNASVVPSVGPWPVAFILGGQKCASTSLWQVIQQHPQICISQGNGVLGDGSLANKEVHFFEKPQNYAKGTTWYLRHFGHDPMCAVAGGKYMDATPNYLHEPKAALNFYYSYPENIRKAVRFVAILREPVARDLSWYNHQRSSGFNTKLGPYEIYSQERLADSKNSDLSWGIYHELLNGWLKFVSRSQLFVVSFRTMIEKQEQTIQQVVGFFGVDPQPLQGFKLPHKNERDHALKVELNQVACATRSAMAAFFAPHNEILYKMLHDNQLKREAPPQEPAFERFESSAC